ncbi:monovalent cation/H(+) antiporter subunit G [Clostridium sp.]|uniref:monovalent cation/H(+) antiporter subunit G n=1 Tax=Clostridium sp. TaxID=1506 RepID=UPI00352041AF
MSILEIVVCLLLVLGIFFLFAGVVGVIRMPDTFCRLTKCNKHSNNGSNANSISL